MRFLWSFVTTLIFAVACGAPAFAQATQSEIAARLVGKPLYLRGFWAADKLSFDAAGKLQGNSGKISFTEAGIDIRSVKIKGDVLEISGQRMAVEFLAHDKVQRLPAKTTSYDGQIQIKITAVDHNFDLALHAIFADGLADLAPTLPEYWQDYATKHFVNSGLSAAAAAPDTGKSSAVDAVIALENERKTDATRIAADGERVSHVGGAVKPPKVLHSTEPAFTQLARTEKFSGNVEVYLWCEKDGSVSHLKIARAVGLGLDEQALVAVSQYKFKPATQDGLPVRVDLFIDVNFQIF